jgi:hypothetical protein
MKPSKIMPEVVRQVALQGAAVVPLRGGDPLLLEKGEVVEERRVEGGLTRKGLGAIFWAWRRTMASADFLVADRDGTGCTLGLVRVKGA